MHNRSVAYGEVTAIVCPTPVKIDYFANQPSATSLATYWMLLQWPGIRAKSWDDAAVVVSKACQRDQLPMAIIALDDEIPIGMASLIDDTMPDDRTRVACLAALYVEPPARGRGVGSQLCYRILAEAQRLGLTKVALYTPDCEHFYARLGWVKQCDTVVHVGDSICVAAYMERAVDDIPPPVASRSDAGTGR